MFTAVPAVRTTRSPGVDDARVARRGDREAPELLDVRHLGDLERRHAPLDRHVLERRGDVRERDDRAARPEPRDRRRRATRERRHEDRLRAERLREVARGVRHRAADRRLLERRRQLVAVAEARLDGAAIRAIVATASTGYSPTAVSADSMTADVPSRIAFATSDASARVGSGRWIIVSSICVAVIAGFPRSSASRMIFFCRSGTSAAPISTPRSPRAIITASATSRIASSCVDRLLQLDLRDHPGLRARRLDA